MQTTMLHGDSREQLDTLADQSVQTIVTSPPYYGLRKYSDDPREIGQEPTPALYVAALVDVFRASWRTLRDDGTLWLNIGDSYASGGRGSSEHHDKKMGRKTSEAQALGRKKAPEGYKDKDLMGIPWRVAFALQHDGWYLRTEIIWHKPNAMPESVKDRPTRAHEYVFLFSKSRRYYYDAAAIAEQTLQPRGEAKLTGQTKRAALQDLHSSKLGSNQGNETRNARTVWSINTRALAEEHYAPMPEALADRCILAGSRAGDTVLDPFAGSGTTLRSAARLQRSAIGIELGEYLDIQERRTDKVQVEMFV